MKTAFKIHSHVSSSQPRIRAFRIRVSMENVSRQRTLQKSRKEAICTETFQLTTTATFVFVQKTTGAKTAKVRSFPQVFSSFGMLYIWCSASLTSFLERKNPVCFPFNTLQKNMTCAKITIVKTAPRVRSEEVDQHTAVYVHHTTLVQNVTVSVSQWC